MTDGRFNKIDLTRSPSTIPKTNEGALELYRLAYIISTEFTTLGENCEKSIGDTPEEHTSYYLSLVKEMSVRGLRIPERVRDNVTKFINVSTEDVSTPTIYSKYHCPNCGNKLLESDIDSGNCGECHGKLQSVDGLLSKPFAGDIVSD
jgi:predicted RNA-binding Zn-ribbon protein involved in translation (DUF1610 family)